MKIYISSDHTGYTQKEEIKIYLGGLGHEVVDKGPFTYSPDDDYPDFVMPMAEDVVKDAGSFGFIFGGSGQGEAMSANRVRGARAAIFYGEAVAHEAVDIEGDKSSDSFEIIKLARMHNDANILSFGVRFLSLDQMKFAIELFLSTKFEGGERHVRRINKLG